MVLPTTAKFHRRRCFSPTKSLAPYSLPLPCTGSFSTGHSRRLEKRFNGSKRSATFIFLQLLNVSLSRLPNILEKYASNGGDRCKISDRWSWSAKWFEERMELSVARKQHMRSGRKGVLLSRQAVGKTPTTTHVDDDCSRGFTCKQRWLCFV